MKKKKKPKVKPKKDEDKRFEQTHPPSIPIVQLFPNENYPIGQIMEYPAVNHNK